MTKEEFFKKLFDNSIYEYDFQKRKNIPYNESSSLEIRWLTGGRTGGSCWAEGEQVYHSISTEEEPPFNEFDKIIEVLCPEISYIKYKKLTKEIFKTKTESDSDYYGNYWEYTIKYVKLGELYDNLNSMNLI